MTKKRLRLLIALIGAVAALVAAFGVPQGLTQATQNNSGVVGRDQNLKYEDNRDQRVDRRKTEHHETTNNVTATNGGVAVGGSVGGSINTHNHAPADDRRE